MKKNRYIIVLGLLFTVLIGCETTELDLQTDPNNLSEDQADPNFVLNGIFRNFETNWGGFNGPSRDIIRMENMFSTYGNGVNTLTLDGAGGEYASSYRLFANVRLLETVNNNGGDIPIHVGIAKIIQAFSMTLLVDYLGDVPFDEALNIDITNPKQDGGASIYAKAFELLDEAIVLVNTETVNTPTEDLFFDGEFDKWVTLANTLKIKMYTNLRLIDPAGSQAGINAVLNTGDFMDSPDEDFEWRYTNSSAPVESRHPFFVGNYLPGGAGTYMSNYLVYLLKDSKALEDPRLRYFLYRQTNVDPQGQEIPCAGNPIYDYCYLGEGYWARDHADPEGLPADGTLRTTYGIYPGGGAYDDDNFVSASNSNNAGGAGIDPIFLSSFTHFVLAENALMNGVTGNPLAYLQEGVRQSFRKVSGFSGGPTIPSAVITDYVDTLTNEYTAAGSNDERLFIISREYFIALFGNGIEAYNMYKRTGMPNNPNDPNSLSNIQSPVLAAGPFPRLFPFPQNVVNNNTSIIQNGITDRVFWDNNPVNFVD